MKIQEELNRIQKELKAPKNQRNKFGNYNYRSCEDILEALKPILGQCNITISDSLENLGNRYYVQAKARLTLAEEFVEVSAFARESEEKKGMDAAQITGAASSYARKYALNGLFAIDDNKDTDNPDEKKEELSDEIKKQISDCTSVIELRTLTAELMKQHPKKSSEIVKQATAKSGELK